MSKFFGKKILHGMLLLLKNHDFCKMLVLSLIDDFDDV